MKRIVVLVVVALVCASCIQGVRAGKRCSTSDWGDDGTYALKCEQGRWVRKATKAQVAALLIAIAKARQTTTTTTPAPPPPIPPLLSIDPDGTFRLRNTATAVHVSGSGGWYGLTFLTNSGQVGVLAHLSDGPNPTLLSAETITTASSFAAIRVIPAGDGSRAAVWTADNTLRLWAANGATSDPVWPSSYVESVSCATPSHIVFKSVLQSSSNIDLSPLSTDPNDVTSSSGCSGNGRFAAFRRDVINNSALDDVSLWDFSVGTVVTVASGTSNTDSVFISHPSNDGAYVGVANSSGTVGGIWNRSTTTVTPLSGFQTGDQPLYVNDGGTRLVGLRGGTQLVQFGPHGSQLLAEPIAAVDDLAFGSDLQSGVRRGPDGAFHLIRPDWNGPG